MSTANREYKDRLFNFIFGTEKNRDWTLSLYNAVNGSSYTDSSLINITTIREVIYLGMHNDVSFLIFNEMNMYEQQSTFNPNMPLRQLQYSGSIFEKYIVSQGNAMNKFGEKILQLPVPKLVVFYNGTKKQDDEVILRLSDSFPEGADTDIDVKVRMININYGHSKKIMEACKPLQEYSWLVEEIRKNTKSIGLNETVKKAINEMPRDYMIRQFLIENKAEVTEMLLTEYNEEEVMELFKEEGRQNGVEEGRKEGRKEGIFYTLSSLVNRGVISVGDAAEYAGLSEEGFKKEMSKASG